MLKNNSAAYHSVKMMGDVEMSISRSFKEFQTI